MPMTTDPIPPLSMTIPYPPGRHLFPTMAVTVVCQPVGKTRALNFYLGEEFFINVLYNL
jgi:hypothetical protein